MLGQNTLFFFLVFATKKPKPRPSAIPVFLCSYEQLFYTYVKASVVILHLVKQLNIFHPHLK